MNQKKQVKIIAEQVEKRTASTKYFSTEDHGGVAVLYPGNVHYEEEGQWKEIDNSLETENTEEEGYQNKGSRMKVKFAKKGDSKKLVTIKEGEHQLSWGFEVPEAQKKTKERDAVSFQVYEEIRNQDEKSEFALKHQRSGGRYADVCEGVDLEYFLEGEQVKENIILKEKEACTTPLAFRLRHKKMELKKQEDGSLNFISEKTKEQIFHMKAPFMYDQKGAKTSLVTYETERVKDGETLLTIVPDKQWLEAKERSYPVIIDPNVETAQTTANIMDAFVKSLVPNESASNSYGSFYVGRNGDYGLCRAFVKFNALPALPKGAVLYDARLSVWQYGFSSWEDGGFNIGAYEVTGD